MDQVSGSRLGSGAGDPTYPVRKVQAGSHTEPLEVADHRDPLEAHRHMVRLEFQRGFLQHWGIHRVLQGQELRNHCHTGPHHGAVQDNSHPGVVRVPVLQLLGNSAGRTHTSRMVSKTTA